MSALACTRPSSFGPSLRGWTELVFAPFPTLDLMCDYSHITAPDFANDNDEDCRVFVRPPRMTSVYHRCIISFWG